MLHYAAISVGLVFATLSVTLLASLLRCAFGRILSWVRRDQEKELILKNKFIDALVISNLGHNSVHESELHFEDCCEERFDDALSK